MKTNNVQARLANQLRLNVLREHFEHANTGEILTKTWIEQISPRHPEMVVGSDFSTALGARLALTEVNGDFLTNDEILGEGGFFNLVITEVAAAGDDVMKLIVKNFRARLIGSPKDSIAVFQASLLLEVAKARAISRMLAGRGVFPEDMIADLGVDTKNSPMASPVIDAGKLITVPGFPDCSAAYRVLILKHLVSQCIEFAKAAQAIQAAATKARA